MSNAILTLLSAEALRAYYASGFWRDDTIYGLARRHAERTPEKAAIRERHRCITYAELLTGADALAADLCSAGLAAGQRVATWLPSRLETAMALLACSRQGYVLSPSFHRDHTVAEACALLQRMRASALIAQVGYGADGGRADLFAAVGDLPALRRVYPLEAHRAEPLPWGAPALGSAAPARSDPNSVVYLAYTSGTTGAPKGVMHSDNTLLANARVLAADWGLDRDAVIYSLSPLSHNLGFGAMVIALAHGGELVVHDLPRGESLVDRIVETRATFLFGVPTHAIDLLSEMRRRGLSKLGAVKGFRISGASVPPSVAAELLERGIVPQSGYGMTEAGSHHYTMPNDDPTIIAETSGRACAGYEVRIWSADNPDFEVPAGEVGLIGGRGASLMLGYFDDQAATEAAFNAHGWFMTGDLGVLDESGRLRVTGRKKDVIIRGGHNIYPARIESLALRHEDVERAAAIPVPDARLGEKVCLAVVFRSGRAITAEDLLRHLAAAGLSKFDMPEYFLPLDAMPLTPGGKILKRELVAWVHEGRVKPHPVRCPSPSPRDAGRGSG